MPSPLLVIPLQSNEDENLKELKDSNFGPKIYNGVEINVIRKTPRKHKKKIFLVRSRFEPERKT
jgi:hypothetical protein